MLEVLKTNEKEITMIDGVAAFILKIQQGERIQSQSNDIIRNFVKASPIHSGVLPNKTEVEKMNYKPPSIPK